MKALSVTPFGSLKGQIDFFKHAKTFVSNQSKFAPWKIDRPLGSFRRWTALGKTHHHFIRDYVMTICSFQMWSQGRVCWLTDPMTRVNTPRQPQDRRPSASFAFVGVPCGKRKPPPIRWSQAAGPGNWGHDNPGVVVETLKSNPAGFCVDYKHLFFGKGSDFIVCL